MSRSTNAPFSSQSRGRFSIRCWMLSAVAFTLFSGSARADTPESIWGGTSSIVWATAGNWGSGAPTAAISAEFTSATAFTNQPQIQANATAQGIWVTGSTTMGATTTISGNGAFSLTIAGTATLDSIANAGILLDGTGNNSLTLASTFTMGVVTSGSTSFLVNNGGTLTIAAPLSIGAGTTLTLGSTVAAGTGSIVISGAIANTAGAVTIVDTAGTTSVAFNAANTYTGATTLTSGTLTIGNSGALQNSTLTFNGGTLSFGTQTAATFGGLTGSQSLVLNNSSSAAVALTVGNNNNTSIYGQSLSGNRFAHRRLARARSP